MIDDRTRPVAYFSMEAALDEGMPTYSGGLGVLSGDTLRAAADLGLPVVGITLLHRQGYFRQHLDGEGRQSDEPSDWRPEDFLRLLPERTSIEIEGRTVLLAPWLYEVRGASGQSVPVYLLDADLPENQPSDRLLTGRLYGGDARYRLEQECILGIGGIAMLRALGYRD